MSLFFHLLTIYVQGMFLTNCTCNLLQVNILLPFQEVHLTEGCPLTTLLNHEQRFDVNQNVLAGSFKK